MNDKTTITLNEDEKKYVTKYRKILDRIFRGCLGVTGGIAGAIAIRNEWIPGPLALILVLIWSLSCMALAVFIIRRVEKKRTNDVICKRGLMGNKGEIHE